jgi:hypothetical protein
MNGWSQMPFSAMDSQFDDSFIKNLDGGNYDDNYLDQIFINEEEEEGEREEEEKEEDREIFVPTTYSWDHFLEGFESRKKYEQRIVLFYTFGDSKGYQRDDNGYFLSAEQVLHQYFITSHSIVKKDNKRCYAPTTLRGWYSMFQKYWLHDGKGNLDTIAPIIDSDLVKWSKGYEEKKSKTFSKEQLGINLFIYLINKFYAQNFVL